MAYDLSQLKFKTGADMAKSLRILADKIENTADVRSDGATIQQDQHRDYLTIHVSAGKS